MSHTGRDGGKLSKDQMSKILQMVNRLNVQRAESKDPVQSKRWKLLSDRINLVVHDNGTYMGRLLRQYNQVELAVIEALETLITILENVSFLAKYLQNSPHITNALNRWILKVSKVWMVLTVKSSVWRYWKLVKLEKAMKTLRRDLKLIEKAKLYNLINLGLCLVEIVELLDLPHFNWIVSIYSVYRMVGNGTLSLQDDEEKTLELLLIEFDV